MTSTRHTMLHGNRIRQQLAPHTTHGLARRALTQTTAPARRHSTHTRAHTQTPPECDDDTPHATTASFAGRHETSAKRHTPLSHPPHTTVRRTPSRTRTLHTHTYRRGTTSMHVRAGDGSVPFLARCTDTTRGSHQREKRHERRRRRHGAAQHRTRTHAIASEDETRVNARAVGALAAVPPPTATCLCPKSAP
jgi:hypothetical protein